MKLVDVLVFQLYAHISFCGQWSLQSVHPDLTPPWHYNRTLEFAQAVKVFLSRSWEPALLCVQSLSANAAEVHLSQHGNLHSSMVAHSNLMYLDISQ
jgi:hypothetical protein